MNLRTLSSVLGSMVCSRNMEELREVAAWAKTLGLGDRERELLNEFYRERKSELEPASQGAAA